MCPLTGQCRARAEGTQELRPAPKRRPRVRAASYAVLVAVDSDGALLMVRRPRDGLLGGLWEFPAVEIEVGDHTPLGGKMLAADGLHERFRARLEGLGVLLPPRTVQLSDLPEVRHVFTHLKVVYRPMLVVGARSWEQPEKGLTEEEHQWVLPDHVEHLPLPVAQKKILDLALSCLYELTPPKGSNPL